MRLRAKLVTWFQAPVRCIASLMLGGISGFTWLQPVDACCTPCPVDPRKKLGVKIKHIIGQNHEPLLLGCTELFWPFCPADWNCMKLHNPVSRGKQSCWLMMGNGGRPLHIIGLFLHVFTLPVCIVDWPDILRKTLASLKEKSPARRCFSRERLSAGFFQ